MKCLSPFEVKPRGVAPGSLKRESLFVSCGKCIHCLINRSEDWATRLTLEAQLSRSAWFGTLTYDEDSKPADGRVSLLHLQKFVRALRDYERYQYGSSDLRYFAVGEYGSVTDRPHYHMIVFNSRLLEQSGRDFLYSDKKGRKHYSYPLIRIIWKKGFDDWTLASLGTCRYVSKYLLKNDTLRVFSQGIGRDAFDTDVVDENYVYLLGETKRPLPKYLLRKNKKILGLLPYRDEISKEEVIDELSKQLNGATALEVDKRDEMIALLKPYKPGKL